MKRISLFLAVVIYFIPVLSKAFDLTGIGQISVANEKTCTATLVSPDTLLTAAHCVYNYKTAQYYSPKKIQFKPYSQENNANKVHVKTYTVGIKRLPKGAFTDDALYRDWALIQLQKPLGCSLTRLKLAAKNTNVRYRLIVAGYPKGNNNQLLVDGSCEYAITPKKNKMLRLKNCSLKHGDSGAPLMVLIDGKLEIVGAVSAGANDSKGRYRVFAVPSESFYKKVTELNQECAQ